MGAQDRIQTENGSVQTLWTPIVPKNEEKRKIVAVW